MSHEQMLNPMAIQENNSSQASTAKNGGESLLTDTALNQRYQAQSVNANKQNPGSTSRSNNSSSQAPTATQIDSNMWKHF
jgi:hypothetical protein